MENENDIITDESLAGGDDVAPSDGQAAENSDYQISDGGISLKDWAKESLGKEFKSDQDAEKAIKDTFNYVGEFGQIKKLAEEKGISIKDAIQSFNKDNTGDFVSKEQYQKDMFYKDNPNYAPYSKVINALSKDLGVEIQEVVKTEEFKGIFDKASKFEEIESSKTVLKSNPKLGLVRNKLSDAAEALKAGDTNKASQSAVAAVLDAYED